MSAHVAYAGIRDQLPIPRCFELDTAFRAIHQVLTSHTSRTDSSGPAPATPHECHLFPGLRKPAHPRYLAPN